MEVAHGNLFTPLCTSFIMRVFLRNSHLLEKLKKETLVSNCMNIHQKVQSQILDRRRTDGRTWSAQKAFFPICKEGLTITTITALTLLHKTNLHEYNSRPLQHGRGYVDQNECTGWPELKHYSTEWEKVSPCLCN